MTMLSTLPSTTINNTTTASTSDLDGIPSSRDTHQPQMQYTRFAKIKAKHKGRRGEEEELLIHKYPPSINGNALRMTTKHSPVPATTLFARKAAPLYFPHLDDYLSKLPRPPFAQTQTIENKKATMFRPMEKLEKLGETLDDLEVNSTPPPFWRNRKSILGSLISIIIGVLVRTLIQSAP
jgi:hypothetical protein